MRVVMRCWVGMVVVKMRRALLSLVRKMTSSRQSPKRSALRTGVDFEPLLGRQPSAVKRVLSCDFSKSHL